jgi:hypothetical protein
MIGFPLLRVRVEESSLTTQVFMNNAPPISPAINATVTLVTGQLSPGESEQQRFARILARPEFKTLKAVFDGLNVAPSLMLAAIVTTNSYQMFLAKVGYRVVVVQQIHENDCYFRLGPKGGIRAVLPVHDTATYSTMVTLVNYDSTVTTTLNAVDFYDDLLAEFKTRLMSRSGNNI